MIWSRKKLKYRINKNDKLEVLEDGEYKEIPAPNIPVPKESFFSSKYSQTYYPKPTPRTEVGQIGVN